MLVSLALSYEAKFARGSVSLGILCKRYDRHLMMRSQILRELCMGEIVTHLSPGSFDRMAKTCIQRAALSGYRANDEIWYRNRRVRSRHH